MALFARPSPPAEAQEMTRLLKRLPADPGADPDVRLRLHIIRQSQMRIKVPIIAQNLDVHRQTVVRWIMRFNRDGLPALCDPNSAPLPLYVRPLTPKEYGILSRYSTDETSDVLWVLYAQAILASYRRDRIAHISTVLGVCTDCLRRWIKAFNHMGMDAFAEMDTAYPSCQCVSQYSEQSPAAI